ncbi:MAG: folate-binding protein [Pseudomonadota bacterium]
MAGQTMDGDATSKDPDRRVIRVGGEERVHFLESLLTCRIEDEPAGRLVYGALLTPQGKIVSDLMAFIGEDDIALDVPAAAADDLVRRLTLYRLRAKVTLEATEEAVVVGPKGFGTQDPRGKGIGGRALASDGAGLNAAALTAYHERRFQAVAPEAVRDYGLLDAFPHDANMDVTHGVDFKKGCFVGQEVVSRMQHRGTARRRTVRVEGTSPLPAAGTPLERNGKPVGTMGSSSGAHGLAVVRIDRAGPGVTAGGTALTLTVPEGAPFALAAPAEDQTAEPTA